MTHPEPVPDPHLVSAMAAGDLGAFEMLYDRHRRFAYSVALRTCGDPHLAEDVVQDAFLGFWRHAERYVAGRSSVRTWLLAIVHHRAVDAVRKRRPEAALPGEDAPLPTHMTAPGVWGEVAARQDSDGVRRALASLDVRHRVPLEMAYLGGLTQRQIAERMGLPLGTVKSRMRLGLQKLREALGETLEG